MNVKRKVPELQQKASQLRVEGKYVETIESVLFSDAYANALKMYKKVM